MEGKEVEGNRFPRALPEKVLRKVQDAGERAAAHLQRRIQRLDAGGRGFVQIPVLLRRSAVPHFIAQIRLVPDFPVGNAQRKATGPALVISG